MDNDTLSMLCGNLAYCVPSGEWVKFY